MKKTAAYCIEIVYQTLPITNYQFSFEAQMNRKFTAIAIVLTGLLAFGVAGCNQPSSGDNQGTPAQSSGHGDHDHGDHSHADQDGKSDMDKMKEALAGLSEEDRAAAMKQHFCPVSGEMLGTMGEPIKVSIKDQEVWICCSGCKKDLEADPDKYLAKIKK